MEGYKQIKKAIADGSISLLDADELKAMQEKVAAFEKSPAFAKANAKE
jgi:hypothetical protein